MELLILKNGHVYARSTDNTATAEDVFEMVMEENVPSYPTETAGKGKYWELDYNADGSIEWMPKDRALTTEERMEEIEEALDALLNGVTE